MTLRSPPGLSPSPKFGHGSKSCPKRDILDEFLTQTVFWAIVWTSTFFIQNEPICTHFRQVLNRERCSILKASHTLQRVLGTPSSTPCTCLLLPHSPFVDLSPAFRRLPPRPRQQLPCMAGVITDAATGAGRAGKGLGWNQAELLAVARAAPDVLQSPINGTNKDTSTLLDIRPLENPLLWASHPNHALG
jgi:hypothetical protein